MLYTELLVASRRHQRRCPAETSCGDVLPDFGLNGRGPVREGQGYGAFLVLVQPHPEILEQAV